MVAAAVAGAPPMATAVESARIGIAKYLVPFAFVYNPSLLLEGPVWMTAISLPLALAGVWSLSLALEGWYRGPLPPALRIVLVVTGGLLFLPPQAVIAGLPAWWLVAIGGTVLVLVALGRGRGLLRSAPWP